MRKVMAPEAPFPISTPQPILSALPSPPCAPGQSPPLFAPPWVSLNTRAWPHSGIPAPGPEVPSIPIPGGVSDAALDGLIPLCVTQSCLLHLQPAPHHSLCPSPAGLEEDQPSRALPQRGANPSELLPDQEEDEEDGGSTAASGQ